MKEIKNKFTNELIISVEKNEDGIYDLRGANLYGANLTCANLYGANLTCANLRGANLRGANLENADLRGVDLRWANLTCANLYGANLTCANLKDANLEWANLENADLRGVDLRWANLRGANLGGVDLRGANLKDANLEWANLKNTKGIKYKKYELKTKNNFDIYILRYGKDLRDKQLRIGCKIHTLEEWVKEFDINNDYISDCYDLDTYNQYKQWFQDNYDELESF